MSALKDLTGQRFGRWTVLNRAGSARSGFHVATLWACRCDCGKVKIVRGNNLRAGKSRSCGCLRDEAVSRATRERHRREAAEKLRGTT